MQKVVALLVPAFHVPEKQVVTFQVYPSPSQVWCCLSRCGSLAPSAASHQLTSPARLEMGEGPGSLTAVNLCEEPHSPTRATLLLWPCRKCVTRRLPSTQVRICSHMAESGLNTVTGACTLVLPSSGLLTVHVHVCDVPRIVFPLLLAHASQRNCLCTTRTAVAV
jgi:hypothetical protein